MRSFSFAVLVTALTSSCSQSPTESAPTPAPAPVVAAAAATQRFAVPIDGFPRFGSERALVTIVEFTDYDCAFCARAEDTVGRLRETYGAELRLAIAEHPLPMHPHARDAALVALARGGLAFATTHAQFFATQSSRWAAANDDAASALGIEEGELARARSSDEAQRALGQAEALATKLHVRGTPTFFVNGRKVVGAQPFATMDAIVREELAHAQALVDRGTPREAVYGAVLAEAAAHPPPLDDADPEPEVVPEAARLDGALLAGRATAPKTIVVFTDYECPYSKRLDQRVRDLARHDADVRVVVRNAPLPMHPHARLAAKAAIAAEAQGQLAAYGAALFAHQDALDREALERYAVDVGLDRARFARDLDGDAAEARLADDAAWAAKLGVKGTPTSFVAGRRIVGAQPLDVFRQSLVAR